LLWPFKFNASLTATDGK